MEAQKAERNSKKTPGLFTLAGEQCYSALGWGRE